MGINTREDETDKLLMKNRLDQWLLPHGDDSVM